MLVGVRGTETRDAVKALESVSNQVSRKGRNQIKSQIRLPLRGEMNGRAESFLVFDCVQQHVCLQTVQKLWERRCHTVKKSVGALLHGRLLVLARARHEQQLAQLYVGNVKF